MTEQLTFVDENDQPIGTGDRQEAMANGYYTRNIRVVMRDETGRILSQQRSVHKSTYPNMWTVAASGHVDEGETWDTAAARETQEEIGVAVPLRLIGDFAFQDDTDGQKIRQLIRVYEGTIDSKTEIQLDESEVQATEWYDINALKSSMKQSPENFTPSFHETINRFY